jgi:outer membrane protein assembly factor BamB
VSLDLSTGRQNWRIARPKAKEYLITSYFIRYSDQCVLVYQDGVILLAQPTWEPKRGWHSFPGTLYAFSAADGELLWKYPYGGWAHNWQPDVFVVDGKVWIHEYTVVEDDDWRTGHRLDKSNIDYFRPAKSNEDSPPTKHSKPITTIVVIAQRQRSGFS